MNELSANERTVNRSVPSIKRRTLDKRTVDERTLRRPLRARVGVGLVCGLLAVCLFADNASAQDRRPVSGSPPKSSGALGKLEAFQSSIKHRLQAALGVQPKQPPTDARDTPIQADGGAFDGKQTRQPESQSSQIASQSFEQLMQSGWQSEVRPAVDEQSAATRQGFENTAGFSRSPNESPAENHRVVEYQQPRVNMPNYGAPAARPLPQPVPDRDVHSAPPQWTDRRQSSPTGRSSPTGPLPPAGFSPAARSPAPSARGTVLGENPVTATEHALRLLEENDSLKRNVAMLEAENAQLQERLSQTQTLLSRSTVAIEQAKQEMEALVRENKQLSSKLQEAEAKHHRQLMETDRMLQSIRDELDDVLIREISATGS